MRKILLATFFVFIAALTHLRGQTYQSLFGTKATSWTIECYNLDFQATFTASVVGDTVLANGFYYKVLTGGYYLLREDTITGRVWYKNLRGYCFNGLNDTSELLIQDMSLNLGDTFDIRYTNWAYTDTFKVVDSVYVANGRKIIHFKKSTIYPPLDIFFTEGIGPNRSPLWMLNDCSGCNGPYLLCSSKDSVQTDYVNALYSGSCAPALGVESISDDKYIVYPNPVTDKFYISTDQQKSDITVQDMTGRDCKVDMNANEIDMGRLPSGMYLISTSVDGKKITRRIVKE